MRFLSSLQALVLAACKCKYTTFSRLGKKKSRFTLFQPATVFLTVTA